MTIFGDKTCETYSFHHIAVLNALDDAFTKMNAESNTRILPRSLLPLVASYDQETPNPEKLIPFISAQGFFSGKNSQPSTVDQRLTIHLLKLLQETCKYIRNFFRQDDESNPNSAEPILTSIREFAELAQTPDQPLYQTERELQVDKLNKLFCIHLAALKFIDIAGKQFAQINKQSLETILDQTFAMLSDADGLVKFMQKKHDQHKLAIRYYDKEVLEQGSNIIVKLLKNDFVKKEIKDLFTLILHEFVQAAPGLGVKMHEQLADNIKNAVRSS